MASEVTVNTVISYAIGEATIGCRNLISFQVYGSVMYTDRVTSQKERLPCG